MNPQGGKEIYSGLEGDGGGSEGKRDAGPLTTPGLHVACPGEARKACTRGGGAVACTY